MSQHLHAALFRQQKARGEGRGKRGDWEQGHTIHASLLGSKEFFNCDIAELAPGYWFCDVIVLYRNIAL